MAKIIEIDLFTNRNTIFFDEMGNQIIECQVVVGWNPSERSLVVPVLERVIADKPKIWIARWRGWREEITIDEFMALLGFGPWYWERTHDQS